MEENERKTLVEKNIALLKQVDAERDALDEVGRGREAEQARQVQLRTTTDALVTPDFFCETRSSLCKASTGVAWLVWSFRGRSSLVTAK